MARGTAAACRQMIVQSALLTGVHATWRADASRHCGPCDRGDRGEGGQVVGVEEAAEIAESRTRFSPDGTANIGHGRWRWRSWRDARAGCGVACPVGDGVRR